MYANLYTLLTRPDRAWTAIRQDEERNSANYLPYLLLFSLLPAVCLFIGTHWVGWSLVEKERIRLEATSALQLSVLLYLATLIGVVIMGYFLRYMSRTFEARPTFNLRAYLLSDLRRPAALHAHRQSAGLSLRLIDDRRWSAGGGHRTGQHDPVLDLHP
jgi:hypothetical protein